MSAITVEDLSKRYVIGHEKAHDTLRDTISHGVKGLWQALGRRRRAGRTAEEFWALRDVSFEVQPGEVIGIIGRNGAGKSTLLKILSRITEPTAGRISIRGRVAALLEVGTGFHPELSGRENIYLNGAILGMTRDEIRRKFDEIVAFAEVERFLDTPVKRYSSGMYVRLAFAVAAHLEPEILIIDEVLAVGDVGFQKKCMGKMQSIAAKEARTVLFVSHNHAAVQGLCSRALLLHAGTVHFQGAVSDTLMRAEELSAAALPGANGRRTLFGQLTLDDLAVQPASVASGDSVSFQLNLGGTLVQEMTELAVFLTNALGQRIALIDLRDHLSRSRKDATDLRFRGTIEKLPLVEGTYSIGLFVNCGAGFKQDFFGMEKVIVLPAPTAQGHVRYPAVHRGVVELEVKVSP